MTLVEFLLARIAEDEAEWQSLQDEPPGSVYDMAQVSMHSMGDRVPEECEAKWRIVNRARGWIDEPDVTATSIIANDLLGHVLACLALPYADHRDYDESWRPV